MGDYTKILFALSADDGSIGGLILSKFYHLVAILILFYLFISTSAGNEYSAVAGDWRVTFSTDTPVSTNAVWKASEGMKNGGFYLIHVNSSYATSLISIFELGSGMRGPATRDYLKQFLQSNGLCTLNLSEIIDYKIDGKDGSVGICWNDEFNQAVYLACYPLDPMPDNTASTIMYIISAFGEEVSKEILDSIHVQRASETDIAPFSTSASPTIGHLTPMEMLIRPAESPNRENLEIVGTRENPIPMGTTVELSDGWQLTVLDAVPNANNMVQSENMFNKPPNPGCQFFLARVRAKYMGQGSSKLGGGYRLRAVGPSSVGYSTFENSPGVIPDPLPDSEVFSGGVITGNVGWEIRSSDANALVMYDEPFSILGNDDRIFMALYGRGTGEINGQFEDQAWASKGSGKMGRY